ncbi:MAG: hypothetical protein JJV97_02095 [SAR324 cluster bacterium]|nr:hypothetical protein [SAR324 cluster bacterium]
MDMIPIDLTDQLVIMPAKNEQWQLDSTKARQAIQKMLEQLSQDLNLRFKINFRLVKMIPHEAGLGGTSGNLAGMGRLLMKLLHLEDSKKIIKKTLLSLGKDVAFFLDPMASIATNMGDELTKITDFPPNLPLLIVKPKFGISTKKAYLTAVPDDNQKWNDFNLKTISHLPPTINNFWHSRLPFFDELASYRQILLKFPAIKNVFLTGSGSTLVAVFGEDRARDLFFNNTAKMIDWGTFYQVNSLRSYKYQISTYPS